jgi:hypothetical protein
VSPDGKLQMFAIAQEVVPEDSLLKTYRGGASPERWGHQGDCFSMTVDRPITLADFVTGGTYRHAAADVRPL